MRAHALTSAPPSSERQVSDEAIVRGIQAGEPWAADALYDRVYASVDRALRRVLRHRGDDFDDWVQSTFERLVLTIARGKFQGACALPTFASAVAAHVGIDALRARVRERALFPRRLESTGEAVERQASERPEQRLEARAEVERVQAVLARMKPEYAETLVLHDVLGHDLAEVSLMTGASHTAAQSRLVRARKQFVQRMGRGGAR